MKIKFDVDTFLHFDKLNIKHIDISNFEIKILASENFEDESKLVEKTFKSAYELYHLFYRYKALREEINTTCIYRSIRTAMPELYRTLLQ